MDYQKIDWNTMWQQARTKKSWKKKKSADWDKRAASYASRQINTPYAGQFIKMMQVQKQWTVLDMGCGPGTLALPLALLVQKITAVDFSGRMLNELQTRSRKQQLFNIETIQASWTDDWQEKNIGVHDVALASRSMSVHDLAGALQKLNDWASHKVFISDRVGSGPFDPDIFAAIGRDFQPGPDFIFTLNILHKMGIHPKVDYIPFDQTKIYPSRAEAIKGCHWMLEDLTSNEERKLETYVNARLRQNSNGFWEFKRRSPIKWAIISWEKEKYHQ